MDIHPLNGILNGIGSGGEWDEQRQLQRLISQWQAIVGDTVAQHSCPLEVRNGVLLVATSTAVWAQNLSFERRRILKKLNQRAHFQILKLKEIRFSTAQWHNRPGSSGAVQVDKRLNSYQQQLQWQQHPSRLPPLQDERSQPELAESATQAFDLWSQRRQQQINQVPPCPQCQTPTPEGELHRWGICAFCMTQQWQAEKDATQPDGSEEAESWAKGAPSNITVEEARQARLANANADVPAQPPQTIPPKAADLMQHLQASISSPPSSAAALFAKARESQAPLKTPLDSSQAPAQQLQPRSGLPPVAWPQPIAKDAPAALEAHSQETPSSDPPSVPSPSGPLPGSSTRLSRDPAATGPLAPLSNEEWKTEREQRPWSPEPSMSPPRTPPQRTAPQQTNPGQPEAQQPFAPPESPGSALHHQHNSANPQQAAWAQAFQNMQSQEEQRQREKAELERRTVERMRQVHRDRPTHDSPIAMAQFPAEADSVVPEEQIPQTENPTATEPTANLNSGRSKPVLKKKY